MGDSHRHVVGWKPGRCVGGGFVNYDTDAKTMVVCGESGTYGREPNREKALELLRKTFPGHTITEP